MCENTPPSSVFVVFDIDKHQALQIKLNRYHSKRASLIYENCLLTAMVYHLFQNFPRNFCALIKENNLTHRDFVHDFKNVPFWYLNMLQDLIPVQNKIGREISESEVLGAINYLKQNNQKVTQQSVAEIVGCHFSIHKQFVDIYQRLRPITTKSNTKNGVTESFEESFVKNLLQPL